MELDQARRIFNSRTLPKSDEARARNERFNDFGKRILALGHSNSPLIELRKGPQEDSWFETTSLDVNFGETEVGSNDGIGLTLEATHVTDVAGGPLSSIRATWWKRDNPAMTLQEEFGIGDLQNFSDGANLMFERIGQSIAEVEKLTAQS